jgi:hypothetical protein
VDSGAELGWSRDAKAIQMAARRLLGSLPRASLQRRVRPGGAPHPSTVEQLLKSAVEAPLSSLGTCEICGTDLQFKLRRTGLYVCCLNDHCALLGPLVP